MLSFDERSANDNGKGSTSVLLALDCNTEWALPWEGDLIRGI